ncbi:hypothetical protein RF11_11502 [Thelohanellus kitauei]|uniref:Lysosome-associated membrane glycoprotein 1 n=1 Tax=Thelohanellus kitauei TaxID=669202 RepID=A0A0C2MC12_THEKT|nr:hypothetical protein RF11_11502 [Thelohanellus kitauei]
MLVCCQTVFLILSNLIGFTDELYTKTLQLKNHDIHVQSEMYVEFSLSPTDKASYDAADIKDFSFNSDGTELNVKFMNDDASQWCKIDCNSSDTASEITIGGCAIQVHSGGNNEVHNFVLGHKFKLRKNTKYDFAYHSINFKLDEIGVQYFGIVITSLVIEFGDQETCELKNNDFVYHNSQFNSLTLVTLCKSATEKFHTQSYAFDETNPKITQPEKEKGNTGADENVQEEDIEEPGLGSTWTIVIISITVILISITLVVIGIFICKKGNILAKIQQAV